MATAAVRPESHGSKVRGLSNDTVVWTDALVVVKLIAMAEVQDVRSHDTLAAQHKRLPRPQGFRG